jgi:hypothetical protein
MAAAIDILTQEEWNFYTLVGFVLLTFLFHPVLQPVVWYCPHA